MWGIRSTVLLAFALLDATAVAAADRAWTVEDSIGVRYFVSDPSSPVPGSLDKPSPEDRPAVVAPDGRHFFFISFHGELETDSIVYELAVHASDRVRSVLSRGQRDRAIPVEPIRRLRFASSGPDTDIPIRGAKWETHHTLLFLGIQGAGARRLYRYDITDGRLTPLTPEHLNVAPETFSPTGRDGRSVVFTAFREETRNPFDAYPFLTLRSDELAGLFKAKVRWYTLYASHQGEPATEIDEGTDRAFVFGPWVSPDGNSAVAVYSPRDAPVPAAWRDYEFPPVLGYRYMLIDIARGTSRPILDGPVGTATATGRDRNQPFEAFWSSDSSHVLLSNTTLPLTEDRAARQRTSYVVDYDVRADRWTAIDEVMNKQGAKLDRGAWIEQGSELLIPRLDRAGNPQGAALYAFRSGRWQRLDPRTLPRAPSPPTLPGFDVRIEQSVNDPPVVVAARGDRNVALTDADPALRGLWRAPAQTVRWKEPDGATVEGLLMLPREKQPGERLPLVIQGLYSDPHAFRPDGAAFSAFAAQALVAQGFAVLQVDLAYDDQNTTFMTPQEAPARVTRIDAAVERLADQGIIDPERVGLIGFSRSGYSTYYIVTHPGRVKLRAAIVFDSITASYGEYVHYASQGDMSSSIVEKQYGPGTFWENKEAWMRGAPSFNVDKVVTPTLFCASTPWTALETVGAFRLNRRPFDYLIFPHAAHQPQRPRERVAAMQVAVDWMNFWLRDRAPEAGQEGRADRWRAIKSAWHDVQSKESLAQPDSPDSAR